VSPFDVIQKPVLSEKAIAGVSSSVYSFFVHPKASRTQVKDAVEKVFNVNVQKVNIQVVQGKEKRLGRFLGRTPQRKKAIVTLASGQRIQQLEGLT
jgi:large subunit ribosomal protein L23